MLKERMDECCDGYNVDIDNAHRIAQEADALMEEMAEALDAIDPMNTGFGESMDWIKYNEAMQKVRASLRKYKEQTNEQ